MYTHIRLIVYMGNNNQTSRIQTKLEKCSTNTNEKTFSLLKIDNFIHLIHENDYDFNWGFRIKAKAIDSKCTRNECPEAQKEEIHIPIVLIQLTEIVSKNMHFTNRTENKINVPYPLKIVLKKLNTHPFISLLLYMYEYKIRIFPRQPFFYYEYILFLSLWMMFN